MTSLFSMVYRFRGEKEWREGRVIVYDKGGELARALDNSWAQEEWGGEALDKILQKDFGLKDEDVVFYIENCPNLKEEIEKSMDVKVKAIVKEENVRV